MSNKIALGLAFILLKWLVFDSKAGKGTDDSAGGQQHQKVYLSQALFPLLTPFRFFCMTFSVSSYTPIALSASSSSICYRLEATYEKIRPLQVDLIFTVKSILNHFCINVVYVFFVKLENLVLYLITDRQCELEHKLRCISTSMSFPISTASKLSDV